MVKQRAHPPGILGIPLSAPSVFKFRAVYGMDFNTEQVQREYFVVVLYSNEERFRNAKLDLKGIHPLYSRQELPLYSNGDFLATDF